MKNQDERSKLRTLIEGLVPIHRLDCTKDENIRWINRNISYISNNLDHQTSVRNLVKIILENKK